MGLSWGEAKAKEQDRTHLQGIITALCPSRDDEVSKKVSKTQNKEDKRVEKRKRKKIVWSRKDMKYAWVKLSLKPFVIFWGQNQPKSENATPFNSERFLKQRVSSKNHWRSGYKAHNVSHCFVSIESGQVHCGVSSEKLYKTCIDRPEFFEKRKIKAKHS